MLKNKGVAPNGNRLEIIIISRKLVERLASARQGTVRERMSERKGEIATGLSFFLTLCLELCLVNICYFLFSACLVLRVYQTVAKVCLIFFFGSNKHSTNLLNKLSRRVKKYVRNGGR